MRQPNANRHREKGFTLTEVMIASGIAGLAFALCAMAVMGFRFQGQTTYTQLQTRLRNHNALEKVGRQIMQATQVKVEEDDDVQVVHLWHDDQEVWTPETIKDDTEGILFLHADSDEIRYRPNINQDDNYEVIAEGIDKVEFWIEGKALFMKLTMTYDSKTPGAERQILASFVVRNNPKIRLGASN
jgi:prepilin-type N-terminal cleavage/methylation domain-containing protein